MQDFGQVGEVTVTKDDTLMMKVCVYFYIFVLGCVCCFYLCVHVFVGCFLGLVLCVCVFVLVRAGAGGCFSFSICITYSFENL